MKQRIITAICMGAIFIPMALYSYETAKVLYIILMYAMCFEYLKSAYSTDSDAFPKLFLGILGASGLLIGLYYFEPDILIQNIILGIVVMFILYISANITFNQCARFYKGFTSHCICSDRLNLVKRYWSLLCW